MSQAVHAVQPQAALWRIVAWDASLSAEQVGHVQQLAQSLLQACQSQPQAWLVLDGWADNPAAGWLEGLWPEWCASRKTLLDPAMRGMEERAPCLLPLHDWPRHESDPGKRLDALHDLLGLMWLDTERRLVRQNLCGIVLTAADVDELFDHWLLLGQQVAAEAQERVLFRHLDPRTLQRVWPSLSAPQRATLLGPVHSVWQLQAPWGPWAAADLQNNGDHYLPEPGRLQGTPPHWHVAQRAQADEGHAPVLGSAHRLLNTAQLQLLECIAPAQACWQGMAMSHLAVPVHLQPNAQAMRQMCHQMHAWRAQHPTPWNEHHAREWLWCTWFGPHTGHPEAASGEQAVHWGQAPWAGLAVKLATGLNDEPGLGLLLQFEEILSALMPHTP